MSGTRTALVFIKHVTHCLFPACISLTTKKGNLTNMERSQNKLKKYTPTYRIS